MCGAQLAEGAGKPDPPVQTLQQAPSPATAKETAPEDVPLSFLRDLTPGFTLSHSLPFGTEPLDAALSLEELLW